nr:hypothetical protein [Novosphingobium panipatense]
MEKEYAPRPYGAVTAISAVLALTAIPALAQDMTSGTSLPTQPGSAPMPPTVIVPSVPSAIPPSAAPPPTTSVPDRPPERPMVTLPEIGEAPEAVPEAADPAEAAPPVAAPYRDAAQAVARSAPEATRVPTQADLGTARDGALAQGDAVTPVAAAAPRSAQPVQTPAQRESGSGDLPAQGVLGLLAPLGVAGAGIAAMLMRRRKVVDEHADHAWPAASTSVDDFTSIQPLEPAAEARPAEAGVPVARGGPSSEALSQGPVPLAEDRQALLDAMVAAAPNAANPFTSHKARMRRARLILQHREHMQMQGKPFDWRTYRPTMQTTSTEPVPEREDAEKV